MPVDALGIDNESLSCNSVTLVTEWLKSNLEGIMFIPENKPLQHDFLAAVQHLISVS